MGTKLEPETSRAPLIVAAVFVAAAAALAPGEEAWVASAMEQAARLVKPIDDLIAVGDEFGTTWGIILVFALMWLLDHQRRDRTFRAFIGLGLVGGAGYALKVVFFRQRPEIDHREGFIYKVPPEEAGQWFAYPPLADLSAWADQSFHSFPSGHSLTAAFLASVLTRYYPRGAIVWWTLAIACMLARFTQARHYPADTLAGAAIGIVGFYLIARMGWIDRLWAWTARKAPAPLQRHMLGQPAPTPEPSR